jgi:hypothetical protein
VAYLMYSPPLIEWVIQDWSSTLKRYPLCVLWAEKSWKGHLEHGSGNSSTSNCSRVSGKEIPSKLSGSRVPESSPWLSFLDLMVIGLK